MIRLFLASTIMALGLGAAPALAQDFVDTKVQELYNQGYTHFSVVRGTFRSEITAYGLNVGQLEVTLSNADGSVVELHSDLHDEATVARSIAEIENRSMTTTDVSRSSIEGVDDLETESHVSSGSHQSLEIESDHGVAHVEDDHGVGHSESDHGVVHVEDDHGVGHSESDRSVAHYDGHDDDHDD